MTSDHKISAGAAPVASPIDPDLIEPAPAKLPGQFWQPWTLIVPALLIFPLLALAFSWQISPATDEVLRQPRVSRTEQAAPTPTAALPLKEFTMFVPGEDELLHPKTFPIMGGQGNAAFADYARLALVNLFAASPEVFPPGAKIDDITLDQEDSPPLARLSMDDTFWNSNYWAGETRTHVALEAIIHTLNDLYQKTGGSGVLHVQLLRNGQDTEALGQYPMDKPLTPDASAVAAP